MIFALSGALGCQEAIHHEFPLKREIRYDRELLRKVRIVLKASESSMRQIGTLLRVEDAEHFADHLRADGIGCRVDQGQEGYQIWVHDDDQVAAAKMELAQFHRDPSHERFRDAPERARSRLLQEQQRLQAQKSLTVNVSEKWDRPRSQVAPLTYGLIALTTLFAYLTQLEPNFRDPFASRFFFSTNGTFTPILEGEYWRIVTPMFLHFGLMHYVFNMLWLYQFGLEIEERRGSLRFISMVLVIAALSNAAQFWFPNAIQFWLKNAEQIWFPNATHFWFQGQKIPGHVFGNPQFGGMSGVVYGLFGYIWIKGRLDPESGFDLPQQTVTAMLIWHVLCVVGIIPNVANWCHGIGLVTGIAIAFIGTFIQYLRPRK